MLRLVAYAPDGVRRFPVPRSELLIGSWPECDIYLPYTGVAQRHAKLSYDGNELRIEDLGSRRGMLVSGKKVREASLAVLDEIRLGGVTLLVEDVAPELEKAAPAPAEPRVPAGPPRITPERMLEHLCRIGEWVLADTESRTTSENLVSDVLVDFGGGVIFLLLGELDQAGIKLVVATEQEWLACGEELLDQLRTRREAGINLAAGGAFEGELAGARAWYCHQAFTAVDRSYFLVAAFPRFTPDGWSPVESLRALGNFLILGLVHHVGWYEPILPGHQGQQDLTLDPSLVIGESQAMKRVVDELRVALDPAVHVLLRGEPGVGKEALARSLHLSGPRRHGPFITATCSGAKASQIEADLFGAEVPGKGEPVRREGKLALADRGTIFLDEVDQLPMELQERLVRFLRSGEVEPTGSRLSKKVDVRVVAGSRTPLEATVARDLFRVDLAYRLSQMTIDVPPLRERREDLPLLIQSCINRFCHETGKRMQGITVKAMSALLSFDYPGNLPELENIARQLVYLCPAGRPVDVNLLPERVRQGSIQSASRVDSSSDLDLDKLVGSCEQAAIREALRRTHGNKSHAARLLGLSRNGLAIKMERYSIKT
jgi:DNA-binding NtrC family response regulator/pSer/pThr/pTyr-binding forkhead associated (FHA) protein